MRLVVLAVALLGCSSATPASEAAPSPAAALIGTTPPAWQVDHWINSEPRTLESLRGSVVLVRWWTAGCPYCSTSAPALRAFHRDHGPRGLVVIGMYHHKGTAPFDPAEYEATATRYGFTFPLAFDPGWRTLGSWMREVDTGFTSVTFLLDKQGVVRHVHPGGDYVAGDPEHAALERKIVELL